MKKADEIRKEISRVQANNKMDAKNKSVLLKSLKKDLDIANGVVKSRANHPTFCPGDQKGKKKSTNRKAVESHVEQQNNRENIIYRISKAENPKILNDLIREARNNSIPMAFIKPLVDKRERLFIKKVGKVKQSIDKAIVNAYQKLDIAAIEELDRLYEKLNAYLEYDYRETDIQELKKSICANIIRAFAAKSLEADYKKTPSTILEEFYLSYPSLTSRISNDSALSAIQRGIDSFFADANTKYCELVRAYKAAKRHYEFDRIDYKLHLCKQREKELLALLNRYPFLREHVASKSSEEEKTTQPESLVPSPSVGVEIKWSEVTFGNRYINVGKYGHFDCEYSRSSLNALTKKIDLLNLPPLIIKLNNYHVEIVNLDALQNVVLLLSFKDDMANIYNKHIARREDVSRLISNFNKIERKWWKYLFGGRDLKFVEFLFDEKSPDFKIVPVREVVNNGTVTREDDGFIFTINRARGVYIIWESLELGKATYIFKTTPQEYDRSLQDIYNYIVSSQENKRLTLCRSQELQSIYGYKGRCIHSGDSIQSWKMDYYRIVK